MVTHSSFADDTAPSSDSTVVSETRSPRQIPWGYGRDRLTALPVDPHQLFIYWELLDEALSAGRAQLGDTWSALVLRVYDTSGRIFDGTNAHSYFDNEVQRNDRQWFCMVGKPGSSAHVELGLRASDGRFIRLLRSGRVDFPRANPAPPQQLEWMRVIAETGDIEGRERPAPRHTAPEHHAHGPGGNGAAGAGGGGAPGGAANGDLSIDAYEIVTRDLEHASFERFEYEQDSGWQIDEYDPELFHRSITMRWEEFSSGIRSWEIGPIESSWEAGPFPYPAFVVAPSIEMFQGQTHVHRVGEQVRVLHGPWQVVIRGIQPRSGHRVIARWEIHRSWVSTPANVNESSVERGKTVRFSGASERLALGASELRLRGASEVFFLGASERRLGGASELRFIGASQWIARGASERRLGGASEWRMMGASERRLMGASERRLMGASERRLGGASERRLGGASERQALGASERRLGGASETRWVAQANDGARKEGK